MEEPLTVPHSRNPISAAIAKLPRGVIHAFTDGSCEGNPGPAGCGVVLIHDGRKKELSVFIGEGTNNIAELTAVKLALEAIKKRELPVALYLDSTYVIGTLTQDWKIKANHALIAELRDLVRAFPALKINKVNGHANVALNERADTLARAAITQHTRANRLS